ncbi:arylamine N-acetyltransferase [Nocardia cyriacigeorgica]|uniref:Arylamine N-acetyltransferase n=1 Tax=Nocardia cyriacigeorgica TaxID=135487 RepID=A0A6P1D5M9_9NOCA|nr:arylamine N-acetyltransferase [Nocardia cyriacigeorgica]NEW42246.1 arylamine N-acetyltransferase [Nocardia cyriacigeorgica]NEW44193.1 arylamine N-acetyltransferase [Nocardia cyriacigeorgica]NEW56918.1 arylamine N-acetyltransferase [Nocardia cyriacigeorgica]
MSAPLDPSYRWGGEDLDLDAYLARIGFEGERAPTLATLRSLVFLHVTTFPFENLEIILGRPINLDVESLQDKMVRQRRGGYCFENSGLFAAVLERLGFGVTGLSARIFMGTDNKLLASTHAMLRVTTADDDRIWLCDVGFGSGPMAPIELTPSDGEFTLGEWRFRLERGTDELGGEQWSLHHFNRDGWAMRRTFGMTPQYRIDNVVGNHYVSTSTHSPFTTRPVLQRFHPDVHYMLDGLTLLTNYPDGTSETRELERSDLPKFLTEVFDIELTEADTTTLVHEPWPSNNTPQ